MRNLALLVVSDGLRTVLEALSDSLLDFGRHAARLFLVAVDHPETRQWLRPGIDLEVSEPRGPGSAAALFCLLTFDLQVVLAGFTEVYGSGALVLEKVKASAEIVAMLLKSWSGELRSGLAKLRHRLLTAIASPAQVSSTSTSTEGRRSRRWSTLCRTSLPVSASVG